MFFFLFSFSNVIFSATSQVVQKFRKEKPYNKPTKLSSLKKAVLEEREKVYIEWKTAQGEDYNEETQLLLEKYQGKEKKRSGQKG